LMAYIIGLTVVMQYAFWRAQRGDFQGDVKAIYNAALTDYQMSGIKATVHKDIKAFVEQAKPWKRLDRDVTLEKVEELIKAHLVKAEDIPAHHASSS
jgi:hypothetical protein